MWGIRRTAMQTHSRFCRAQIRSYRLELVVLVVLVELVELVELAELGRNGRR